jgi:hypothetical protein
VNSKLETIRKGAVVVSLGTGGTEENDGILKSDLNRDLPNKKQEFL